MLLMPDSELYIIPAEGGEARRLRANTPRMNSWHSWSSNGRWLVFSSKANTAYTQLFLTHIDENGESTPPVVLERFTGSDRAANIPEFVPLPAEAIAQIKEQFLDAYSFLRAGMANERTGNYPGCRPILRAGTRRRARERRAAELPRVRVVPAGQEQGGGRRAGEGARGGPEALEGAQQHGPRLDRPWRTRSGRSPLSRVARDQAAGRDLQRPRFRAGTRGICPTRPPRCTARRSSWTPSRRRRITTWGRRWRRSGKYAEAESHLRKALKTSPNTQTYTGLGIVLWQLGRTDEAIASLQAAIKADPKNATAQQKLAEILESVNDPGQRPR